MNSIFKYPKAENLGVAIVWKNSWLTLLYSTVQYSHSANLRHHKRHKHVSLKFQNLGLLKWKLKKKLSMKWFHKIKFQKHMMKCHEKSSQEIMFP